MVRKPTPHAKPLFFTGSSRKDLKEFPDEAQSAVGFALWDVQNGKTPNIAKPMKGFGGVTVMEIVADHRTDTYRVVYTAKFAGAVFVLHCFQKKSKTGIATTKQDVELIEARLKFAQELHRKFQEAEKTGD